jgi:hypothetical protein
VGFLAVFRCTQQRYQRALSDSAHQSKGPVRPQARPTTGFERPHEADDVLASGLLHTTFGWCVNACRRLALMSSALIDRDRRQLDKIEVQIG